MTVLRSIAANMILCMSFEGASRKTRLDGIREMERLERTA